MMPTRVFFGFSGANLNLADTLRTAAGRIDEIPEVKVISWEHLRIGGKLLLDPIEQEILGADICAFDLTQLNENVLFELGLAIGANRIVWPLRDAADKTKASEWSTIGLLDTLGQVRFTNSSEIYAKFLGERPDLQSEPLFATTLAPALAGGETVLFYAAEPQQTDAGRQVTDILGQRAAGALPLVIADPREASVQTLAWYAQQVYAAAVVVVHLAPTRYQGHAVHNARASMIAGLARGLKRPLLMLAEVDHVSALDYRELLYRYPTAAECATRLNYWLERELVPVDRTIAAVRDDVAALRLSTELGSIDLGEYVAENEASGLTRYFVETASFREVISGASRVYVGSKGSGKSATVLEAARAIHADKRDLVCVIKPAGYDLEGVVKLLGSYPERDEGAYLAESLWKYLLTSELALAVERDLASRPAGVMPEGPEWALLQFIAENGSWLKADFATRLERAVGTLLATPKGRTSADRRTSMSEPFHAGPLRALRTVLAPALAARRRVSVIVDNLDKAWDVGADVPHLSRLMLALLAATEAFRNELERSVPKAGVSVSLSLFMRSDIFAEVARLAHEPDKLPVRHLRWEDEVVLLQVVEQRYAASRKSESAHGELWSRFFCERVGDERVTDWLMRVCLPRPRDVLFLCRAAIDHAVAARHARIEEQDLTAARGQYSLFAFESAAVESQLRISRADDVLLEFAGAPTTLVADQLAGLLDAAGVAPEEHPAVLDALRDVSFLGIKTGETGAVFADVAREKQRADILARKWAKQTKGTVAYEVHPAFWAYLEMERAERNPTLAV